ncbi:MAG: arsenosugar biosynthesis radical SAM protein ArsS [Desulfohalobiaceae bacterium]|nr:arsenosugar biosynthesis radical SAM protein ArsS [Desulfohalobiaceae bacterium]
MQRQHQLEHLARTPNAEQFHHKLASPIYARNVSILQLNVGKRCTLSCKHCHVEAGPERWEVMSEETFRACLEVQKRHSVPTLDITGGSPELNPNLEWFINQAAPLTQRIILRSNLQLLAQEDFRHLIDFFAERGVELVVSLPAYTQERTDKQRGQGSFETCVQVMRELNQLGYAQPGSGLALNLVHNPVGAYLPGSQTSLEQEYRRNLEHRWGVRFNRLFALTNSPVGRYLEFLIRSGNFEQYMDSLIQSFNPGAVEDLMCRDTLSVAWDGGLYDCDFNQMLDLPVDHQAPSHIRDFDLQALRRRRIAVGNHCFSCTAGAGSSCQGALETE